ncbi:hypothetical protein E2C01_028823 [Portunus trituberculatus]|uniref:Uncharacterized protein n=1 Tax=Portunus trituberculatus TaxID=210409 RepID=A0A5B7ELP5_PORTR|nr:hypothetical protein [Portunus trituberculatus]
MWKTTKAVLEMGERNRNGRSDRGFRINLTFLLGQLYFILGKPAKPAKPAIRSTASPHCL